MKYIKTFENSTNLPKIGDYVIVNPIYFGMWAINIVRSSIGQIVNIEFVNEYSKELKYTVAYGLEYKGILVYQQEIIAFSKNKEELEPYIIANKYNL